MAIHPTAVISSEAQIDPTAEIGPFAVVDGAVRIGPRTRVFPNAYLAGWTEIGADCEIHPNAVVGHVPQDFHFGGERSYCRIGDGTIIREGASVHRGTQPESWTIVGPRCFLLASSHVGHNCVLGEGVKVYNCAALSGHVEVGDFAIVSGYSLTHQFVRIGAYCMIGGGARLTMDVPPYMSAVGETEVYGYNSIGLRRSGAFSSDEVLDVKTSYRTLYRSGLPFRQAVDQLAGLVRTRTGRHILEFVRAESRRGIAGGASSAAGAAQEEDGPPDRV